jgi:hypothetical protein
MTTIINTKSYKIEHINNTSSYTLYIRDGSTHEIYESIMKTNILTNVFFDEDINGDSIIFTAETVKPLTHILQISTNKSSDLINDKDYDTEEKCEDIKNWNLTNEDITKMIYDLSRQIAYLEKEMIAFYGYNLDDIIVINKNTYFIANTRYLSRIEADNNIYFNNPIEKPYFSNPELNQLTKLPSKIDYRSGYYSLGALILFCLTNIYIFGEVTEEKEIISLESIKYTKAYWFLKRCFHDNCKERILLFI